MIYSPSPPCPLSLRRGGNAKKQNSVNLLPLHFGEGLGVRS